MGNEPEPAVVEPEMGILGCLGTDGTWTEHRDKIQLSNGMAWTKDRRTMFFIDSLPRHVYAFDYDPSSGNICKYNLKQVNW